MSSTIFKFASILVLCVAAATQLGNGCTSDGSSDRDDDYDYDRPSRPDYGNSGYNDRDIPRRARVAAEGRGDVLKFRAAENGRVWLTDADRGRTIDSRALERGEEYIISTKDGKVWIDGDRKLEHEFDRDNVHRIYFLPSNEEGGRRNEDDRNTPREEPGPVFGGAGVPIPKSASIVREGRGEDLSFQANGAGIVFVYDNDAKTSVASHRLKNGQRFTVSPSSGEGTVDGKVVFKKSLSTKKNYRLYFDLSV